MSNEDHKKTKTNKASPKKTWRTPRDAHHCYMTITSLLESMSDNSINESTSVH